MATEDNIALRQRFDLLKGAEHHKNALIEVSHVPRINSSRRLLV